MSKEGLIMRGTPSKNANRIAAKSNGDNIIEAHCAVCDGPVTRLDIDIKFAIMLQGKWVHVIHVQEYRDALASPGVIEAIEVLLKERDKNPLWTGGDYNKAVRLAAEKNNIPWPTFEKAHFAFMCYLKYKLPKKEAK